MKPRFTSLFSGCGGVDLGFLKAGYSCTAAFDFDKDAVSAYRKNVGNHINQVDLSIPSLEVIEAVAASDVLVAGPPCQGFSTAGKQDLEDIRNTLILKVVEIAAIAKPRIVIIENVRGLLSPKFKLHWEKICESLKSNGYEVASRVVEATEFGVAQSRRRVIIMAILKHDSINLVFPIVKLKSLKDALLGIEGVSQHIIQPLTKDSQNWLIARRIAPGQKLSNVRGGESSVHTWDIPEVFGSTTKAEKRILEILLAARRMYRRRDSGDADPVSLTTLNNEAGIQSLDIVESLIKKGYVRKIGKYYDITNTFNGKFRRLRWEEPAPTVDTRFGQARYFLHPEEDRGFSIREAARIQGFPDDYIFPDQDAIAYRLIGNAVPPPMAKAIALLARRALND